ncbi:DUF1648 domain-containing protein [Streptomyces sp. DSM 44915]|uniref:DUF1648 domain-containing protein n=1 Tax=Streptomyces chisholmiae TaxID=3075540 RepID=A0ABU2JMY9_9ACTN|nr:DUF1648 domain-containing protein [Streptomyces sp. DSM 44915]MDT0266272.1 DUF1648 domain-containing protein [Streptomyces sp. DSM 44915]
MRRTRRVALVAVPHAVVGLALAAVAIGLYGRLPDRMAVHFDLAGAADGFQARGLAVALSVVVPLSTGAVLTALTWFGRAGAQRLFTAVGAAVAVFLGPLLGLGLAVNAGLADPADARLSPWWLPALLAVAGLVGWAAWRLAGDDAPEDVERARGEAPVLRLRAGEAAVWSHQVGSRSLRAGALVTLLGALVALLLGAWAPGGALLLLAVLTGVLATVRVTVDAGGLRVAPPLLSRPRLTVPLARIESAEVRRVSPVADFGGWGYRVRPGATGLVLRSGEALQVRRAGGRAFVVTVDDAHTAAALLNGLVARRREGSG